MSATDRRPVLPAAEPVEIAGVPDGLAAYPLRLWKVDAEGEPTVPADHRVRGLHLRPPRRPAEPDVQAFLAEHPQDQAIARAGWGTLKRRQPAAAWDIAVRLARAGVIDLVAKLDPGNSAAIGALTKWRLTQPALDVLAEQASGRREVSARTVSLAAEAADRLAQSCLDANAASLVQALRRLAAEERPSPTIAAILAASAEAIMTGQLYAGGKAFSQRHFADSKAVDADRVLEAAGVEPAIRQQLGIYRYGDISIAGPITISNPADPLARASLRGFPGPWTVPADPNEIALSCHGAPLVVIENKDPAQHLSRTRRDLAIWFLGGYSGPTQLHMLAALAATATTTVVITDSDPHGVNIAGQVVTAIPDARLIDLGEHPHMPRSRPYDATRAAQVLKPILDTEDSPEPLRSFAQAVLSRGYEVEQDDVTAPVLDGLLPTPYTVQTKVERPEHLGLP